ncbi:MAG: cell division protein FtsQ/DivIB [Solirubrobacteraceae bacterium]
MERSFAARSPAGRPGASRRRAASGGAARRASPARAARRGLAGLAAALRAHRRARLALVVLLIALPLLGGGFLWLRQSSFVAVEHVRIVGVHGPQASAIDAALTEAARGMSTLDPKPSALRAAVASFPLISALRAIPGFPHSMRIVVSEQPPVAALLVAGVRTAVAGDGVVLGPGMLSSSLPTVAEASDPPAGTRLRNPLVLDALTVLGAAPPVLDRLAARAYEGPRGLTVAMRNGLLVYFGDAARPHAKWLSLARVLSDKSSAGATYVDVRLPEKPAAGFTEAGAGPEGQAGAGSQQPGTSESTVSALAAGLAAKIPPGSTASGEPKPSSSAEPSEAGSSGEGVQAAAPSSEEGSHGTSEPGG